jgi:hypothetical protein
MFSKLCPAFLMCLFAGAVFPGMCRAADDADFNRDLLHTVAARRALLQDKDLGPLNIGVKVHKRVATLWGTIPSREHARRAYEVLRKLPDLIEVRDEMRVEPSADRPLFLPDIAPERLRLPPLPPPQPGPPVILAKRPVHEVPKAILPSDGIAWRQLQGGRKDPRMPDDREIEVVMSAALPVPSLAETAPKPLPQALQDLQRDKRFSNIQIEMKGDTVYLRGASGQAQGIFELARILAQLPGAQHVVVKEN